MDARWDVGMKVGSSDHFLIYNLQQYSSFKHLCNTHTQMGKPQCKPTM